MMENNNVQYFPFSPISTILELDRLYFCHINTHVP